MADEVSICNGALGKLGESIPITSLAQGNRNANLCNQYYDRRRRELLRKNTWAFATTWVKLAQLAEAPVAEFDRFYQLPADFYRVIKVSDNDGGRGRVRYKIEGDRIAASREDIWLRYVRNIVDVNKMPPDFRTALEDRIAWDLAMPVTKSRTIRDTMKQDFRDSMGAARSVAAIEDFQDDIPDGSWITVRHGGIDDNQDWVD